MASWEVYWTIKWRKYVITAIALFYTKGKTSGIYTYSSQIPNFLHVWGGRDGGSAVGNYPCSNKATKTVTTVNVGKAVLHKRVHRSRLRVWSANCKEKIMKG